MAALRELQAERKEQQKQAMEEAKLLAQANLIDGLPYLPEQDGFEFSATEINRAIDRDNRLKAAKKREDAESKPCVPPAKPAFTAARAA